MTGEKHTITRSVVPMQQAAPAGDQGVQPTSTTDVASTKPQTMNPVSTPSAADQAEASPPAKTRRKSADIDSADYRKEAEKLRMKAARNIAEANRLDGLADKKDLDAAQAEIARLREMVK